MKRGHYSIVPDGFVDVTNRDPYYYDEVAPHEKAPMQATPFMEISSSFEPVAVTLEVKRAIDTLARYVQGNTEQQLFSSHAVNELCTAERRAHPKDIDQWDPLLYLFYTASIGGCDVFAHEVVLLSAYLVLLQRNCTFTIEVGSLSHRASFSDVGFSLYDGSSLRHACSLGCHGLLDQIGAEKTDDVKSLLRSTLNESTPIDYTLIKELLAKM